jgi:putative hydroxymethylpyrimidine transport system substrate-binding protein
VGISIERTHQVTRLPRPFLAALAALAAASALAACGEKKDTIVAPKPSALHVMLDWTANADHAPLYAAQAEGYFKQAGLTVDITPATDPTIPLRALQAGKTDLAISYEPELLLARDKGADLVAVGALVQKPLTSIMSLASKNIRRPANLDGKTVGTAGIPYQSAYLRTIADHAGVDPKRVHQVDVGFNLVPAMLSGRVDATLGAFWNYEGVQLAREGKRVHVIRMDRAGVPTYDELIFVARADSLRGQGGERVRRFLVAVARGAEAVRKNPRAGVTPLVKANRGLDVGLQIAAVRATRSVFFPSDSSKPFGWQDPTAWAAYSRWMVANHLVKRPPSPASLTNEFVPGEGL